MFNIGYENWWTWVTRHRVMKKLYGIKKICGGGNSIMFVLCYTCIVWQKYLISEIEIFHQFDTDSNYGIVSCLLNMFIHHCGEKMIRKCVHERGWEWGIV